MAKSVVFILLLLFVFLVGAAFFLWSNRTRESYVFTGFVLLVFVTIYSVSVLGYRITGTNIGIEEARKEIETSKKEISTVATTLLKITYLVADGSGRWGGMPQEHLDEIRKLQSSLHNYLPEDLEKDVQKRVALLNEQINLRNKKQEKK
jgi:hypothetical protein